MLIEKGQNIRNDFNGIKNNARKHIEEGRAGRKISEEICETKKTSRKKLYANVQMMFSNMKREI